MENRKLKPKIKTLFLEALRSGKYKQGATYFYNASTGEFCVMGVYIDLYLKSIGQTWDWMNAKSDEERINICLDVVEKWGGIDGSEFSLISMNDRGESFEKIANFIEENY